MMAVPTIGFIYVAYLSILHSSLRKKKTKGIRRPYAPTIATGKHGGGSTTMTANVTQTRTVNQQMVLAGVLAFLVMGAGIAYYGYQTTMYPINKAIGFMSRAQTAQTPEQLAEYVGLTKDLTLAKGNPVWLFPTPRTDFALIRENLDGILLRAESTSTMVPHSEQYNIAMRDMHKSVMALNFNLMEAVPYMYISFNNIVMAGLWVAAVIAIFAAMRKARPRVQLKTV